MKKLTLFALSALLAGTFAVATDMGMKDEMEGEMKDANMSMQKGMNEMKGDMKDMKHEMGGMKEDTVKEGKQMKDEMKGEMKKEMKKEM